MICVVVATSISGCGEWTNCRVVCECSRTLHTTLHYTVCRAVWSHPAYFTAVYREWRYQMLW